MTLDPPLLLGIAGCTGRMGLALCELAAGLPEFHVAGGGIRSVQTAEAVEILEARGLASIPLFDDIAGLIQVSDVVIDFTSPEHSLAIAAQAAEAGRAIVCGTTGFTPEQQGAYAEIAVPIPVVLTSNSSLGVALFASLVEAAAAKLGPEYDIEIVEMHHRLKKDAPSGTALLLGEAAARGRGISLQDHRAIDRDGTREPGAIGFASLRGGDVIGDHSVIFAGPGERFELTHRATDRRLFARGALQAARWLAAQPPGLYAMRDVMGL